MLRCKWLGARGAFPSQLQCGALVSPSSPEPKWRPGAISVWALLRAGFAKRGLKCSRSLHPSCTQAGGEDSQTEHQLLPRALFQLLLSSVSHAVGRCYLLTHDDVPSTHLPGSSLMHPQHPVVRSVTACCTRPTSCPLEAGTYSFEQCYLHFAGAEMVVGSSLTLPAHCRPLECRDTEAAVDWSWRGAAVAARVVQVQVSSR